MYEQIQPWTVVGPPPACLEQKVIAAQVKKIIKRPEPQPWTPVLGFESIELPALTSQPVTNTVLEPCYIPVNMVTKPLRFPNLITGIDRNPLNAARASLYTKYLPSQWKQTTASYKNEAETIAASAKQVCSGTGDAIRQAHEKNDIGQKETTKKMEERIRDTTDWRDKVDAELEKVVAEANLLQEKHREMTKAEQDIEPLIHLAQECLAQRDEKFETDRVHDEAEKCLLKEIETLRNCQARLKYMHHKSLFQQLNNNRDAQQDLEREVKAKEGALQIDKFCKQLNNFSGGLSYFGGIEKIDNTVSNPESWSKHCADIIKHGQNERDKSSKLRMEADNMMNECAAEIKECWEATNKALAACAKETEDTANNLRTHLKKIQAAIFEVEDTMKDLRQGIIDNRDNMKVAHTRLERRSHRRDMENCQDAPQSMIVEEAKGIVINIDKLNQRLQEAEAMYQQLLKSRATLELDLTGKNNSLFIDREKCMCLRTSFARSL